MRRGGVSGGEGDARPDDARACTSRFPQYAFASHKGYCTPEHDAALQAHGPCEEHRYSFVNVRQAAGDAPDWRSLDVRTGCGAVSGRMATCPSSRPIRQDLEGVA